MLLPAIAALLLCQLAGDALVRGLALPVPGPVAGLLLLLMLLAARERLARRCSAASEAVEQLDPAPGTPLGRLADGLLAALGLLFVPAGVGVVDHLPLLAAHGWGLAFALVASTLVTLLVTVGAFLLVARLAGERGDAS